MLLGAWSKPDVVRQISRKINGEVLGHPRSTDSVYMFATSTLPYDGIILLLTKQSQLLIKCLFDDLHPILKQCSFCETD